jgi:biopolymer transport protein ExbB/TolQ
MSADLTCPHCGVALETPESAARIAVCVACDQSFGIPGAFHSPSVDAAASLRGGGETAPTDVPLLWTGAAALAGTALFFAAVVWPFAGTYIGDLLGARGWVPYVISWLAIWAGVILGVKTRALANQRRSFSLDLLPEAIAPRITVDNARIFEQHLEQAARPLGRNFLTERLLRALSTFRSRRSTPEVLEQLAAQAGSDAAAVESSYTMVRVFIWAIPILGFIGTVIGIGAAVSGFSTSVAAAVDLEVMKSSIGAVTSGLGVAFDTTLLALVVSILIMFPASSLQKAEEDLLVRIDQWCETQLTRRLQDDQERPRDDLGTEIARLARSVDALEQRLARPPTAP